MNNKVTIFENVTVITMNKDKDIIENGVVAFQGNKIIYVGNSDCKESLFKENKYEIEVIDGEDGILMPGMINCHTHASMVPFRSLADDCKDRLKRYLFPLEQRLVNEKLTYIGAKYAVAEMLLGGVTTFCDMYYFEDEVAKATKELNMRGILCETIVNFPSPDSKEAFGGLNYSVDFIEKWRNDALITPGIAPHAPYTNTDESLKEAYNISKKYNVPITMHVAEMDYELKEYVEKYNLTPVEYLNKLGVLDSNFIAAHTILVNDDDIKILKENGVGVSHNIGANAKGAKGVAPIIKMKKEGINVGLGTDGPMSGNTLDILTQMSQVGKVHKLFNNDRTLLPSIELVEMGTIGGAKVLGIDKEIGSIEVGKKADLTLIETKSVNMQPIYDYYAAIVYSANAGNVDLVVVDGKVVVKNKKLLSGNFLEIRKSLLNLQDKINKVAREL
ncbi:amidohydrolase [Clostridium frigidicarnis]|uniref:Cytosine/adenosine deaminase n=1 Tax=Clostridium frigidicarnis TaxID=84698 RepID=A0A1I0X4L5_9CLOT|nr:amidohydrolase [Clostridium frigidicarnis]SFA95982.1 Cytosine/adenosine deaminase [Clostridium frigidicarnis]